DRTRATPKSVKLADRSRCGTSAYEVRRRNDPKARRLHCPDANCFRGTDADYCGRVRHLAHSGGVDRVGHCGHSRVRVVASAASVRRDGERVSFDLSEQWLRAYHVLTIARASAGI